MTKTYTEHVLASGESVRMTGVIKHEQAAKLIRDLASYLADGKDVQVAFEHSTDYTDPSGPAVTFRFAVGALSGGTIDDVQGAVYLEEETA